VDFVDVLGPRPERRPAFAGELLAETTDVELQEVVETAARDLSAPIALVSLVLDQIQWFKAHYGLPSELAAARATRRDVSFCQFVVRDDAPFAVEDAPSDDRVPQQLPKAYGVRAYLGMPVHVDDTVVGSLCVLDTEARDFTESDRQRLAALAESVDQRLTQLSQTRNLARSTLSERSTGPALEELSDALDAVRTGAMAAAMGLKAVQSYHRLFQHYVEGGAVPPKVLQSAMRAAHDAVAACEDTLDEIGVAAADGADYVVAIEGVTLPASATRLSEVLMAAQDLARPATKRTGSFSLPDVDDDPVIVPPRQLAVGVVASAIMAVAARLESSRERSGLRLRVWFGDDAAWLGLSAAPLSEEDARVIAGELSQRLGEDPSLGVEADDETVRIRLRVRAPRG
jgi:hypothetical protein